MQINTDKLYELMQERQWSELKLSRKLGIDYSYMYRILRGQRDGGRKLILGLLKFCEKEGLDYRDFIQFK